jgi:2-dehydro-3-deoxyphosphooctonate aldolase (KDO 8-P synthase)
VDGVFMEVHQDPPRAKSDAQNALRLDLLPSLLDSLTQIHQVRWRAANEVAPAHGASDR